MDETGNTIFNLFVIAFLLFSNGFFVASEFAMVKVRKTRIEQLVNEGNFNAKIALEALKDLDKFIAAVQLGVTISSIGLGWVGEGTLAHIIEPVFSFLPGIGQNIATHTMSVSIAFALITFFHVVLGELIPKSIALEYTEKTALWVARPMQILTYIFNPFIEGFKSAFGIHSPSTVMEEQGGYVISGLWEGIKGAWHNITDFFSEKTEALKTTLSEAWGQIKTDVSEKFSEVKENLSETWENVKTTASETWEELSSTLSESWESIKTSASEKFEKLRGNISTAWGNVKTDASVKWAEISTTVSDKWESIKTTATDKFGEIKGKISDKWDEVKKSASTKWEEISSELSGKADSIKTMFDKKDWASIGSNICSGIKEGIKDGWSWLTDTVSSVASNLLSSAKETLGIHSPSRLFHDIIGLNIGYGIGEGIKDSEPSVIGTVSDVADAIAAEFSNGDYSISGNYAENGIDGAVMTFSDTITDEISELMNKLQNIADNVSFVVPAMAEGTIVPYGTSKKQIKEQYDSATPAASSADTIKQALLEVLGSQSGGDINLTIELDGDVVYKTIVRKNRQNTRLTGVNALGY